RGVDHVREEEEDDRDAGDAVEQPGVLPLMALVDGAVVALLLARSARHSGIPPSLSRGAGSSRTNRPTAARSLLSSGPEAWGRAGPARVLRASPDPRRRPRFS